MKPIEKSVLNRYSIGKASVLTLIFCLFYTQVYCQKKVPFKNPPGTIILNDSLYIDVAPIDNMMYQEYFQNRERIPTKKLDSILKINKPYGLDRSTLYPKYNEKDVLDKLRALADKDVYYTHHPKFTYYPVLELTKSKAELYCEWRTKAVLLNYAVVAKTAKERKNYAKNLIYRLPTKAELLKAVEIYGYVKKPIKGDDNLPFSPYRLRYKKKYKTAKFIKNNLSEYTLDSLPFGTNWRNKNTFSDSNDYTGFRCVCEIIE